MSCFINIKEVQGKGNENGVIGYRMLTEDQGCIKGCRSGINYIYNEEYLTPGVHEDQEGFLVMEGTGVAKVGEEEFKLEPDMCFIAAKGVAHCMKKDPEVKFLKVFWFHSAV